MVNEEGVVKFVTSLLGNIVTPGVLQPALQRAVAEAGWDVPIAGLVKAGSNPAAAEASTGKKRKKEKEADGAAPKETKRRPVSPYQLFVSLALDRISKSPEAPGYKVQLVTDENGNQKERRGGKMAVASGLWARVPEETKNTFTKVFKPLSDILHDESNKTGHKIEDIPKRAQEFLNQLPDPVRGQIEQMFAQLANPAGTPAAAGGAAAGPSKPAAADSDSDDDDDSDSDSDSDDKQQPKSAITPGKAGAAAAAKPASAQKPSTATKPKPAAPAAAPSSQPKADKPKEGKEKDKKEKKEKKEKKHKHKDKKQKHNDSGSESS